MAAKGRGRGIFRAKQEVLSLSSLLKPQIDSTNSIGNDKDKNSQGKFKSPSVYVHMFQYTEDKLQPEDWSKSENEYEIHHPLELVLPLIPGRQQYLTRSSFETVRKYHCDMKKASEVILEGMEILCVTGAVCNPSEMYLVMGKYWPKKVDNIVAHVSDFYNHISSVFNRYTWFPEQADIKPGLMVAAYIQADKEWFRGRILFRIDDVEDDDIVRFSVQLVDTGETHTVEETDIFYLDSYFMDEPQLAIKCRLDLDANYGKYHSGLLDWPRKVGDKMFKALFDKRFYAKFVRCVKHKGEMVWEVSIEGFNNEPRNPEAIHDIIRSAMEKEKDKREDFIWKREYPRF